MTDIHISESTHAFAPPCEVCGGTTRIFGVEPHPRLAQAEIHTFVCDACDKSLAMVAPMPSLN
ncbi:MAG TPA: hypothetical protein VGM57_02395 [Pseudolabrys sp.]|jgi:hypothetical protein